MQGGIGRRCEDGGRLGGALLVAFNAAPCTSTGPRQQRLKESMSAAGARKQSGPEHQLREDFTAVLGHTSSVRR
jgi:hypothetical protein